MKLVIVFFLCLVSVPSFACVGAEGADVGGGFPLTLVMFNEPFWSESEIPKDNLGKVTATFMLSENGKPINVKIIDRIPKSLNKNKLKASIEKAKFTPEIDLKKGPDQNKQYTYTFELTFENKLF